MFRLEKFMIPWAVLLFSLTANSQVNSLINLQRVEGRTMGTTYSVAFFETVAFDMKTSIDSLLKRVNEGINHYDAKAEVSLFNKNKKGIIASEHFKLLTRASLEVAKASAGRFDPTVMPLVNLWGFGPEKKHSTPSSRELDSVRKFVGYTLIEIKGDSVIKKHPQAQLDFGGIGQGYAVDVIRDFLVSKGVKNFLVELGGEGYAAGENLQSKRAWRVGLIDPMSSRDEQRLLGYALVTNSAFTTSGNYFNYRIIDGKKVGHTIDPSSGLPVQHSLVSVSVFSKQCTLADAWATAFMVCGDEQAVNHLSSNTELGAMLVSLHANQPRIFISDKIKDSIILESSDDR